MRLLLRTYDLSEYDDSGVAAALWEVDAEELDLLRKRANQVLRLREDQEFSEVRYWHGLEFYPYEAIEACEKQQESFDEEAFDNEGYAVLESGVTLPDPNDPEIVWPRIAVCEICFSLDRGKTELGDVRFYWSALPKDSTGIVETEPMAYETVMQLFATGRP